ncbi:uncharacterized protein BKCO1_7700036 [Diplodia corticola]|uniref:Uncharacterized protein n=1 Tax=Diplodia corticola TaxID=236234 RepID=A0A1J9RPV6_9PEZI|nr:uncharacterized protein BKCO1_7700036 [Diplodia corticola]OJD29589.1 hypothetical protein BKCO1_7700036 [Diplodia corticola]
MRAARPSSRHGLPLFALLHAWLALGSDLGQVPLCYYPDGTVATNDYACRLDTAESFCCTTNVSCLDNKICDVLNPTQYRFNRGTCTDKTWTSAACPQFCQAKVPDYGCGIIRCPDAAGKVCCDTDHKDATATCCQDPSNLFDLGGAWDSFRIIDTSAASSTKSLSSSTSTSAIATGFETPAPANGDGGEGGAALSAGAIAGIAVGGVAGLGGLGALALWWMRSKKKGRKPEDHPAAAELDGMGMRHEMKAGNARHELGGREAPQELCSGDERHEMEGSSPLDRNLVDPQEQGKASW